MVGNAAGGHGEAGEVVTSRGLGSQKFGPFRCSTRNQDKYCILAAVGIHRENNIEQVKAGDPLSGGGWGTRSVNQILWLYMYISYTAPPINSKPESVGRLHFQESVDTLAV